MAKSRDEVICLSEQRTLALCVHWCCCGSLSPWENGVRFEMFPPSGQKRGLERAGYGSLPLADRG